MFNSSLQTDGLYLGQWTITDKGAPKYEINIWFLMIVVNGNSDGSGLYEDIPGFAIEFLVAFTGASILGISMKNRKKQKKFSKK